VVALRAQWRFLGRSMTNPEPRQSKYALERGAFLAVRRVLLDFESGHLHLTALVHLLRCHEPDFWVRSGFSSTFHEATQDLEEVVDWNPPTAEKLKLKQEHIATSIHYLREFLRAREADLFDFVTNAVFPPATLIEGDWEGDWLQCPSCGDAEITSRSEKIWVCELCKTVWGNPIYIEGTDEFATGETIRTNPVHLEDTGEFATGQTGYSEMVCPPQPISVKPLFSFSGLMARLFRSGTRRDSRRNSVASPERD